MVFNLICSIIIISGVAAIAVIGYVASERADRLMADNERLRRMNAGQRRAIERLQEQLVREEFL